LSGLRVRGAEVLRARFPRAFCILEFRWLDAFYEGWVARVQQPVANAAGFFDTLFINGLGVRAVCAGIPGLLGLACRRGLHSGDVRVGLAWAALGAAVYGGVMWWW
jgi:hypothetical protein